MARTRNPAGTRAKLLHAASEELGTRGLADLTLDHVAAAAGVSKGGLLHHFPTKLALLEGLAHHLADLFIERHARYLDAEPAEARGRWTRSYVHAAFDTSEAESRLNAALAGALTAYPQLIDVYTAAFCELDAPQDDGLPAARSLAIRLACDGLWLAETSGSPPIPAELRDALYSDLMEQTR